MISWQNLLLLFYITLGYYYGITGVASQNYEGIMSRVFAIVLLSHVKILSAYLVHDCLHGLVLKKTWQNELLGNVLLWISGGCYAKFTSLKRMHLLHHSQKVDSTMFDYRILLARYPMLLKIVKVLEYFYLPAVEWIVYLYIYTLYPIRNSIILFIRVTLFAYYSNFSHESILYYLLANNIMINVMRFIDAFQHTYDVILVNDLGQDLDVRDVHYEQKYTFTNIFISDKYSLLARFANALFLNVVYHNAHHQKVSSPWYKLPLEHRQLEISRTQVLPIHTLLIPYHRRRVERIMSKNAEKDPMLGLVGVSLLTDV